MVLFGDNFRELAEFQRSPTASNTKIKKQSKNQILLMRQKFYEKKNINSYISNERIKSSFSPQNRGEKHDETHRENSKEFNIIVNVEVDV